MKKKIRLEEAMTDLETNPRKIEVEKLFDRLKKCSYYELLEIDVTASAAEIQTVCNRMRALLKRDMQSDNCDNETAERINCIIQEIEKASQVLCHQLSRNAYDQMLLSRLLNKPRTLRGAVKSRLSLQEDSSILIRKQKAYALFKESEQAAAEGSIEKELVLLKQASSMEPGNAFYMHKLGCMFSFRLHNIKEGEKMLLKSLQLEPHNAEAWFNLAQIYMKANLPHKARSCLKQAIAIDFRYAKYRLPETKANNFSDRIMKNKWKCLIIAFILLICIISMFKEESSAPPPPPFIKYRIQDSKN